MAKPKLNLASFTGVVSTASGTTTAPDAEIDVTLIDVERQVRTDLGDLTELAASIKDIGVLEPIILLAKDGGRFRLIAGERRYRASILAEKPKVPAIIKRGLTDFQVRQIQVTENNDREGLSAYDEAIGVAEDVEKFGFKEAMRIWNRSEGWVSKRMAVKKYAEPVRELLQAKVCGDLEVLHSLNQLYGVSINEYNALVERMRSGVTVSRDDARNKVSSAKVWQK
ncbi:ParB/RepB/Spo0J family partition protein, partial [Ideonella sp. B508-1]|uniref:ParB/RepB/Spo0J family partition protein n=1 Tax=Ideonella sp. B508-1 TaxID=137716 RepID=UPI0003B3291D